MELVSHVLLRSHEHTMYAVYGVLALSPSSPTDLALPCVASEMVPLGALTIVAAMGGSAAASRTS